MKIHEYQAKELLREYGVRIPEGRVASTPDEVRKIAKEMQTTVVVKAQVHVGGRGKAGGVKLAKAPQEALEAAKSILGMNIKGSVVKKVLVEKGMQIKTEMYVGITIDRARKAPMLMVSAAGGVEIEEVAAKTPEKLLMIPIDVSVGIMPYQLRRAAFFLGIPKENQKEAFAILSGLYNAFIGYDASLAEINPLVITEDHQLIACDAKINFDDNALFRQKRAGEMRDRTEEEELEAEAKDKNVSYVKLDGQIGCIVNGAGLAMATMDTVKLYGGEPANFLDIGGTAKSEQVTEALRIVTADKNVNTVFFNIFGGIVRCDLVAQGILDAQKQLKLDIPIVIRLCGTNEDQAREMLKDAGLITMPTMADAAKKVVELSKAGSPVK